MKRIAKSQFYFLFIFCFVVLLTSNKLYAQCDVTTPSFEVDLSADPDSVWTTTSISRADSCCNRQASNETCIRFNVTLNSNADRIVMYITNPSPVSALYYYIDCDSVSYMLGDTVSFPAGPHTITYCKSGTDQPTYAIGSVRALIVDTKFYVPDSAFRSFLQITYSTFMVGDSLIKDSAATLTGTLNCSNYNIYDLSGIEYFVNITDLTATSNNLTSINVTQNTKLTKLFLNYNNINVFPDISNNLLLEWIYITSNSLPSFPDVSNHTNLQYLSFNYNNIDSLPSFANNTQLRTIGFAGNNLTSIPDLSNNTALTTLSVPQNQLTSIPNISMLTSLTTLFIHSNQLTQVPDLTTLVNLKSLYFGNNPLNSFPDLSANSALEWLSFDNVGASDLQDLSHLTAINTVYLTSNKYDFSDALGLRIIDQLPTLVNFFNTPQLPFGTQGTFNAYTGDSLILSIAAQDSATGYQWYRYGSLVPGATNITLVLPSFQSTDSGSYTCRSYGTALSASVMIKGTGVNEFESDTFFVNWLGNASPLVVDAGIDQTICPGDSTQLNAVVTGGTLPYFYSWSPSTGLSSSTVANPLVTIGSSTTYYLTVTDTLGIIASDTIIITSSMNVGYTVSGDSCLGGTYSFTNTGASPSSCGMNCPTFYWDFGDGTTTNGFTSSEANPSHIYSAAGTYTVSFSIFDGSCSDTITKNVTVYDCGCSLGIVTTSTDESCKSSCDGSALVSGYSGSLPYTYRWSNGATGSSISSLCPGTYTITVTDDSSCQKTQSVTVNSGFDLAVGFNYVGDTCINNAISFTNTGAASNSCGMGCPTFFWNLGDGNTSTAENPTNTYVSQGSYIVYQTLSGLGCTVMDSQQVIITTCTSPLSIISIVDTVLCGGDSIQLSSVATGGVPPYSYLWSPNNWMNDSVAISPMVSPDSSIWYVITITDSVGTQTVDSVFVDVSHINPVADFTYLQVDSLTVNFYDSSQNAFAYEWNLGWMGGGTFTTLQNPSFTYPYGGSYNVCLVAYDSIGACSNEYCQLVNVDSSCFINVNATITNASCNGSCDGSISVNVACGAVPYSYSWNTGQTTSSISNLCVGIYTVTVTDSIGSSAILQSTIVEPTNLGITVVANDVSCGLNDGSACASAFGGVPPYSYKWATGDTSACVSFLSVGNYTLSATDANGCKGGGNFSISDSAGCDLVWPGDANNDLVANIYDIFPIGLGYNQTGIPRDSISTAWQGWPSQDWSNSFASGLNHKYADCDGDGKIFYNDVFAIADNYGLTHAKSKSSRSPGSPQLFFSFARDTMNAGDSIVARINLGKPSAPVNQIFGIAFTINFNPLLIDSSSITIDFDSSQFGSTTDTSIIKITHIDANGGKIDIGIIRTDGNNVMVQGTVAKLRFVIIDNISGKDTVAAMMDLSFGDIEAIKTNEDTVLLDPVPYSSPIMQGSTGNMEWSELNEKVKMFPNPAQDYLHIEVNDNLQLQELCIINILGEVVYYEKPSDQDQLFIMLNNLPEGMYFCTISTDQGSISKRFTIIR